MTTQTAALDDRARRRSIGFLNWAHFLDHYVILIFPTVVIGLEAVYGRSYGELLVLSTAAFTAFGLFALPSGWLADKWSRRNMIAVYYFGTGICCALVAASDSFETLAIALFGVGLFAAIYHPVGTPMVVDAAVTRGRTMAFNGICGNIGVSIASGCTAVIAAALGWRYAFLIPAVIFVLSGFAYLKFVPDDRPPRGAGAGPGCRAEQSAHHRGGDPVPHPGVLGRAGVQRAHHHAAEAGRAAPRLRSLAEHSRRARDLLCSCAAAWRSSPWAAWSSGWCRISSCRRSPPFRWSASCSRYWTSGWWLLPSLALAVAAIYGQVTVNDLVLARYTPAGWRGRIYAIRFFLIFTMAGPAAWGIGRLYEQGGFNVVLGVGAVIAALGALNTFAISVLVTGAENRRAAEKRAAQQRAQAVAQPAE